MRTITQDDLVCMALILEDIANDLRDGDLYDGNPLEVVKGLVRFVVVSNLNQYCEDNK